MEEMKISRFQENLIRRLPPKLLFSSEEKIRNMYDKRKWITEYIEAMPLEQEVKDEMAAKGSLPKLKKQYITYWSKLLNLEDDAREHMSEIWDSAILSKFEDPDIGRSVIYFHDGCKMTEEAFLSVMLQTFRL